ncbi:Domain of unknown function DUF1801 [Paludibacter propionicigenes WB4]|uniref:YdhG-like domain-containing protein n=1 Tax=Paludibacter propionicigenes (strain DSM 17365 / JCM 13257 / WB4) TaxID=694427 RepID=E4T2F7_PALPW|nr:DUF1801 domain-containing protein [Paludibacter propionicigenes]ADQ78901.1 Domain of unknown function DUF1801 [Paludibacter propionicigenes WB4]
METDKIQAKNIDEYIANFPTDIQKMLDLIRQTIINNAPEASEIISYGMPAFKFHGMLVYFAAYKNHIGFYPGASGIEAFKEDIKAFKNAKGTVQFPIDKPLPLDLISKIVQFRVTENTEKAVAKKNKR